MDITIPEKSASIKYRVPYADTDMMGVVYYGNYLTLFERCRNELMRRSGPSYKQLEEGGVMLPVVEAHVDYKSPAKYDDELTVTGWLAEARGVRIKVRCAVFRGDELLASGYTIHCCASTETKRPVRVPEFFLSLVAE